MMRSYDLSSALKRMGGDEQLMREMIRIFLEDSPAMIDQLSAAVAAADVATIHRISHSLRGLVSTYDAHDATRSALALEKLAGAGDMGQVQDRLDELRSQMQDLSTALMSVL